MQIVVWVCQTAKYFPPGLPANSIPRLWNDRPNCEWIMHGICSASNLHLLLLNENSELCKRVWVEGEPFPWDGCHSEAHCFQNYFYLVARCLLIGILQLNVHCCRVALMMAVWMADDYFRGDLKAVVRLGWFKSWWWGRASLLLSNRSDGISY